MDTLIYVVLLAGAVSGFCQGAFKQVAQSAGVILGLIIAASLYGSFGESLSEHTGAGEGFGRLVAFVLIVVIVPAVLGVLASWLTRVFKTLHLSLLNRLGGAAIGLVCYGLFLSVMLNLYDFMGSSAGFQPDKLEERSGMFYAVKHVTGPVLPDFVIVTDSAEVAGGAKPMYGLKSAVMDKVNSNM